MKAGNDIQQLRLGVAQFPCDLGHPFALHLQDLLPQFANVLLRPCTGRIVLGELPVDALRGAIELQDARAGYKATVDKAAKTFGFSLN